MNDSNNRTHGKNSFWGTLQSPACLENKSHASLVYAAPAGSGKGWGGGGRPVALVPPRPGSALHTCLQEHLHICFLQVKPTRQRLTRWRTCRAVRILRNVAEILSWICPTICKGVPNPVDHIYHFDRHCPFGCFSKLELDPIQVQVVGFLVVSFKKSNQQVKENSTCPESLHS